MNTGGNLRTRGVLLGGLMLLAGCGGAGAPSVPVMGPGPNGVITWQEVSPGLVLRAVGATASNVLVGGVGRGALRSTNSAVSWDHTLTGAAVDIVHAPFGEEVYVVTALEQLFRSGDGGSTWSSNLLLTAPASGFQPVTIRRIWANPSGLGQVSLFIAGDFRIGGSTVPATILTQDGGVSWSRPSAGSPLGELTAFARVGSTLIAAEDGTNRVLVTSDSGLTWTQRSVLPARARELAPRTNDLLVAITSGVLASTDGGATWLTYSQGLSGAPLDLLTTGSSQAYLVTAERALSREAADSWTYSDDGLDLLLGSIRLEDYDGSGYLYALVGSQLYRSVQVARGTAGGKPSLP